MSTKNYSFGQSGTQTANQQSGISGTYFYAYVPVTVSGIKISAAQIDPSQDSFVTFYGSTSDGLTATQTKQISGGRSDCGFDVTLSVNRDTWFNLTFWTNNAVVYWDNVAISEYIVCGWTGSSTTISSIYPYACKFTLTYDPIWTVDGNNDGSARIVGYVVDDFEFTKDDFGYPTNWGVWKKDSSNDGYPWPTGYEDAIIRGLPVKIKNANGVWAPVLTKIFTEDSLNNVYIKLMEGVEPNENNANVINSE